MTKYDWDAIMGSIYEIKIPESYNEDLAYIHALICGDGTLVRNGYRIQISDKNLEMHERIIKPKFKRLFGIEIRIVKKGNGWVSEIKSKNLFAYLSDQLKIPIGEKSHRVTVPNQLFNVAISVQKSYFQGWMDAEGSVRSRKYKTVITPKIEFATKSKNVFNGLIRILDLLGKNYGVQLRVWTWKDKKEIFRFELAGPQVVINYSKFVGFQHPHKKEKIRKLLINYI